MNPGLQLQIGLWLTVRHLAFRPHVPGHGSTHRWFTHDLSREHSELIIHSGRQFGGAPIQLFWQEQTAWSFTTRQMLYGPHGDGRHGLTGSSFGSNTGGIVRQIVRNTHTYTPDRIGLTFYDKEMTGQWRIAHKSSYTRAGRRVIMYMTFGIQSTRTNAWVNTLGIDAWLVVRAVWILNAFWSTANVRITEVIFHACTGTSTITFFTDSIWSTWRRVARFNDFISVYDYKYDNVVIMSVILPCISFGLGII